MALDEIEAAHRSVGGGGPGRRYATHHINQAYAVLLSAQFQGFCRDLHTEAVDAIVSVTEPAAVRLIVRKELLANRKLDRGNPNPGNIGADYNRFGFTFWSAVAEADARNSARQALLEDLNRWRNAIAHQEFDPAVLGGATLQMAQVRSWRSACNELAKCFDDVLRTELAAITGHDPW
ncbi:MAG: hypothetical protein ACRC7O_02580 [Fimbriiglobus sp.]